jgi:putative ABC transport system permease protein
MLINNLRLAWRNIFKNRVFSTINIMGLAFSLTCSLLILLWVSDERRIDAFHQHDKNLYTVFERQYFDGQVNGTYGTPGLLAEEVKLKFPEVQFATSMGWNELSSFEANGKILKESGNFASPDFFTMFSYSLIEGDASTALSQPSNIAISRTMATRFFGSVEDAIGEQMRYKNHKDVLVTAVFEDISLQSSKKFDFILPWGVFLESNGWAADWGNNGPSTYLSLYPGTNIEAFRDKIKSFIELYNKQENFKIELDVQPYNEMYLHSHFKNGELAGGRIQYVVLFSVVAVFILLIACINFMNLSTARSIKRAKEVGIRKVVGAMRWVLIRQFIGESMLTIVIAFVVALLIVALILPVFNEITHKQIALPLPSLSFWLSVLGLAAFTGFISGSYPALYLSSFQPARVLKGLPKFASGSLWFRKGLVVFQFSTSIILIVGTIVVSQQVHYVQSINLGFDRENLIYIPLEGDLSKKYSLFKAQALNAPGIGSVTKSTNKPTLISGSTGSVLWEGKDPNSRVQFTFNAIGYDFMQTLKLELVQGRDFSHEFASDTSGYIINETALKILEYPDPIGMPLTFWGNKGIIVGVVKDFHFNSLHEPIEPMMFYLGEELGYGSMLVRTEPGKTKAALTSLEKICKELNPHFPFTYQFSDDEYQKFYRSEEIVAKLSTAFAFLGIFVSCLGLLGLSLLTTEQRAHEIGVRKVLGASVHSLFHLLTKDLLMLVSIALLVALPLAWWVADQWLNDYAYRIKLTAGLFVITGLIVLLIALVAISAQTIKALLVNPLNSLNAE